MAVNYKLVNTLLNKVNYLQFAIFEGMELQASGVF